ncbi:TerC family protein, partial [Escherichia coli]
MEFLMDPSIWAGLLTLVVLEIVLGIDNLVFIAILADKLPPKQRDKARLLGLSLALIMRLGLLSLISWMVTLTKPLFTVMDFSFSGRDLIMLFGGIFLLFFARCFYCFWRFLYRLLRTRFTFSAFFAAWRGRAWLAFAAR